MTIAQELAEVLSNEPAGAYRRLTLRAPKIAAVASPGQFVACAVGDITSSLLLRRAFSLHRAEGDELQVVVAPHAPGTEWICTRRAGETISVVGPAGHGFVADRPNAVLVGGGYGAAPLGWFAEKLRAAGHSTTVITGAASADRLFGHDLDPSLVGEVLLATEDGSAGTRGRVTDLLVDVVDEHTTVYACGPMAMLRAVHQVAEQAGANTQLAVEESMACGVGVCMTCVLPVRHAAAEGPVTRMTRSCVEGPVFDGAALRWDAIDIGPTGTTSRVPSDCLGAPLPTGGH